MQVTSYETSKKLAEAGFEAEAEFCWVKWNEGESELIHRSELTPALIEKVAAYDFETIWNALPKTILDQKTASFEESLVLREDYISYESKMTTHNRFTIEKKENETLADTAARLLLTLVETGLLTFN